MFLGSKSALSMFFFCVVEQTLGYESNWKMLLTQVSLNKQMNPIRIKSMKLAAQPHFRAVDQN